MLPSALRSRRTAALLLCLAMLLSLCALFSVSTAAEDGYVVKAFGKGNCTAVGLEGKGIGQRVTVNAPFNGFSFTVCTWCNTDCVASMSVFAWKGNFDSTVAEEPLRTQRVDPLQDNGVHWLNFDEPLPAGQYLFLLHNGTGGLWMFTENSVSLGYSYTNGVEGTGDFQMQIRFTEEVEVPFSKTDGLMDQVTGNRQPPEEYVPAADSLINTHPVDPGTWVFTDGLGRVSLTNAEVGDPKDDKTVAMFYWTWHCNFNGAEPLNVQEAIDKYPEAQNDYDHPVWQTGGANFWNESIYGYYNGLDPWVFRRQAELLANAGVDTIFTDNSNSTATWQSGYTALMEAWDQAMQDGVNTPKVSFLLPFGASSDVVTQLRSLYTDIYLNNKYQNLWFYWEGKPMLLSHSGNLNQGDLLEKEIAGFFTYRVPYSHYAKLSNRHMGEWGWLNLYPQVPFYKDRDGVKDKVIEEMTVGVAQNHDYQVGSIAAMNGRYVCGRSYTSTYQDRYLQEGAEASKWGYNFAEQWDYAIENDPKVIFVTGWNEYIAGRYERWPEGFPSEVTNAFPDQFSDEFSRDIEPSKGALQDHYYYQLVNGIRRFKGVNPIPTPSARATIDLSAGYDQWNTVEPYYAAYIGNTFDRDSKGYGSNYYTETSGRNDIIGARVARDGEFMYFLVECNENITPYTDSLWMNLYLDTDQQNQGWNTFEFVLNKTAASATTLVLERFTAENDYAKTEKVADVEYKTNGKYMTVKIAKSDLGLSGDDYTVNFAWTDNVHDEGDYSKFSGDIMDFYVSGDVAPGGRFKYSFISTAENSGTTEESGVSTETTADTPADTTAEIPTEAPAETKPAKSGCGSALAGAAVTILAMAAAVALKKKEN